MTRFAVLVLLALAACDRTPRGNGSLNRGAAVYFRNCSTCHGPDGRSPVEAYPSLHSSSWLRGDPAPLIAIVLDGAHGPFEIDGKTYNGVMPAWRTVLGDHEIADVLSFLRAEFGGGSPPVSASDVAELRIRTGDRQRFWTQEELRTTATP